MKTTARFTRQIISILLCIAMVFAYAPTTAIAEERTYDGVTGECYYKLDSDGKLTIWGNGAISGNTFGSNTDITSVVIEEGVTTIGNNAFRNCSNLKSVIIPSSVTAIGNNAFASSGLTTAEYWGTTEPMGASNVFYDTLLLYVNVPTTYDSEVFCGVMAKKTLELVTACTVTVSNDGNGTGAATPASAAEGEEVTLTATPNTGYKFKEWQVVSGGVTVAEDKFTMGTENVEIKAVFEEISYEASLTVNGVTTNYLTYDEAHAAADEAVGGGAATDKVILKLLKDATVYNGKTFLNGFTLDLNGFTLVPDGGYNYAVSSGYSTIITDSSAGGDGVLKSSGSMAVGNDGTLTILAGQFESTNYIYDSVHNNGTLNVKGGIFPGDILNDTSSSASINIYDGVFCDKVGNSGGNGTVNIYGGTFEAASNIYLFSGGTVIIKGGTFKSRLPFELLSNKENVFITISGGAFTNGIELYDGSSPEQYLDDGCAFVDKDGNTVTGDSLKTTPVTVESLYKASVTDKDGNKLSGSPYATIDQAITAAKGSEGSTLKLLDNIDISSQLYISFGKFTIDLNGKTIKSSTERVFYINSNAEITIKDSGAGGTVQTNGDASSAISNEGNLTIESGIFKGYIGVDNRGTGILTIKNGKFESGTSAIWNYGTAHLYNGVFEGNSAYGSGILNNSVLYVYGGKISGETGITNNSTAYISGGDFEGIGYAAINMMDGTLEVTGGSFIGTGRATVDYTAGDLIFKGGEFPNGFVVSGTTANALLADDYKFYDKDGNRIIVEDSATEIDGYVQVKVYVVASVTDQYGGKHSYKTIDEALTAAKNINGSTLKLLEDIELSEYLYIDSGNFTIDLNGKTLKNASSYTIRIANGAKITIKDSGAGGTVVTTGETSQAIWNSGTLAIESGIFKGRVGVDNGSAGILTIKNGKFEAEESAILNNGMAYLHNGVFEGVSKGIQNINGGILYVYDGKISGETGITNRSTAYISGGDFEGIGYAAINMMDGTLEVTGGSFTGTDIASGYYSGTSYGEFTVYYSTGTISLKGGEFPNGFVTYGTTANDILADGYYFRDAATNGNIITAEEAKNKYVYVVKGAELSEAEITLSEDEYTYSGTENKPDVTVKIGDKTIDSNHYTVEYTANTNAGSATVIVTAKTGDEFYSGMTTKQFNINPKAVDVVWSADEFYYTGNDNTVTAKYVDINGNDVALTVTNGTNSAIGSYTATTTIEDTNYTASNLSHTYEIKWYNGAPKAQVEGEEGYNDYYISEVSLRAPDGYTISKSEDGTYEATITYNSSIAADTIYYLKQNSTGCIAKMVVGEEIKLDLDVPTGEVSIATHEWNKFLNTITFGIFFKDTQKVTVVAADATSGVLAIDWFSSDEALTLDEVKAMDNSKWSPYIGPVTIDEWDARKFVYYIRIMDEAGNMGYICTDGANYDTTPPAISGIIDGATYYTTQKVTVSDSNLESIEFNGTTATENITLEGNKDASYTIVATDKAGNITTVTVTMKPISDLASSIDGIDETNVNSGDSQILTDIETAVEAVDTTNATNEEKDALKAITDKIAALEEIIKEMEKEQDNINNEVADYDPADVKSNDKADLEQLIKDIDQLLGSDNLTDAERKALEDTKEEVEDMLKKIEEVKNEVDHINDEVGDYDSTKITSDDKADLEQLVDGIDDLLNSDNLTDAEKMAMEDTKADAEELLETIEKVAAENERINNEVDSYDPAKVTSDDTDELEKLIEDIEKQIASDNLTDAEKKAMEDNKAEVEGLLKRIEDAAKAVQTESIEDVKNIDSNNVKPSDKQDLEKAKKDLEKALEENGGNYTEEEKKAIEDTINRINGALSVLERVEYVEKLIHNIPKEITEKDFGAVEEARRAYDELSEYEQSLVAGDCLHKLNAALAAVGELLASSDKDSPNTGNNDGGLFCFALGVISCSVFAVLNVYSKKKAAKTKR